MCRDGIPPENCAAVIILALSSSGAKRRYFLTIAQGLLRNVTLQFQSRGWITIPGFPSKKKRNSTGWFWPPPPSTSIGVGMSQQQIGGAKLTSNVRSDVGNRVMPNPGPDNTNTGFQFHPFAEVDFRCVYVASNNTILLRS